MTISYKDYVLQRKKELNAVILAHFYQLPEIQDIADFVGDSLQLSQQAAATDADLIVFCGVDFMAESAKILSPDKMVIIPDIDASCPMANMVNPESLQEFKKDYPDACVITYINSSAAIKAMSDICCTSSNAVKVVASIPEDKPIIFLPDRNLGNYIGSQTGRDLILWPGFCPVHEVLTAEEINEQKSAHPQASVVVHPECRPEVVALADAVRSTAGILDFVKNSIQTEFIIGTEVGFLYTLKKHCPDKTFHLAYKPFECPNMKKTTLPKLAAALEHLQYQIEVPEAISTKARTALERMLSIT